MLIPHIAQFSAHKLLFHTLGAARSYQLGSAQDGALDGSFDSADSISAVQPPSARNNPPPPSDSLAKKIAELEENMAKVKNLALLFEERISALEGRMLVLPPFISSPPQVLCPVPCCRIV